MALDVGDRRIGVALSDPTAMLASPLTTIDCSRREEDIAEVVRLAETNDVSVIVVGMPLSMSGRAGPQARITKDFVGALSGATSIPVTTRDERLSSVQAERMLRESGVEPSRNRAKVDSTAAAVVLQAYLDSQPRSDSSGVDEPPA